MKNLLPSICILFCGLQLISQSPPLIGIDLRTGITDTLTMVEMLDLSCHHSDYNIGNFNGEIAQMPEELDSDNLINESQWTERQPAMDYFDINDYPLRTSIKLFTIKDDSLANNCSGSLISPRHVLTAAHCIFPNEGSISFEDDSILICPIFDQGLFSQSFPCSFAQKIHVFDQWNLIGDDFAILELEEAIGKETGWLSIGYDDDDDVKYENQLLHKFSYPNFNSFLGNGLFNGDTLYHSYGYADFFNDEFIGISSAFGIPGESGSSIIHIIDQEVYSSYGTATWSENFKHCRIQKHHFYPIQEIIHSQNTTANTSQDVDAPWIIYPNPSFQDIHFHASSQNIIAFLSVFIYDWQGKLVLKTSDRKVDISSLANGMYLARIKTKNGERVLKFLKQKG